MTSKQLKIDELVAEHGKDNIVFMVPMRPLNIFPALGIAWTDSNDAEVMVEATIDEYRYKVAAGYMITLQAKDPNYGHQHYYQMDLESIIRDGIITYTILEKVE